MNVTIMILSIDNQLQKKWRSLIKESETFSLYNIVINFFSKDA